MILTCLPILCWKIIQHQIIQHGLFCFQHGLINPLNNSPTQGLPNQVFCFTTFMGTLFSTQINFIVAKKYFTFQSLISTNLAGCMLWQKPAQSNAKSHVSFKLLPSITLTLSALFCKIKSKLAAGSTSFL